MEELGIKLKEEREKAGLSQSGLARISGVSRTYIIQIEKGRKGKNISPTKIIQLANALQISARPFLESIGLKCEHDFPEINKLSHPTKVPIYKEFPFHAGAPVRPVDHFYRVWPGDKAPKNIEGYIVRGTCLEPDIKEGDVIIVDRDGAIDNGDIVACRMGDELHVGRLRKIAGELYLENGTGRYQFTECVVAAPVIEINRRIK